MHRIITVFITALAVTVLLSGCNQHTRISNENAINIMQAQQQLAEQLLTHPEVPAALVDMQGDPLTLIESIKHIAESGEKALKPVREMLAIESTFLGIGTPPPVEADVSVQQILEDPAKAMGRVDFRTTLANQEVDHHPSKRFLGGGWGQLGAGISGLIMTLIMSYLGVKKVGSLRAQVQESAAEAIKHRLLAKNAVHYGKDVEAIAKVDQMTADDRRRELERRRSRSMQDQLKHGITDVMDSVLGEVKRERGQN